MQSNHCGQQEDSLYAAYRRKKWIIASLTVAGILVIAALSILFLLERQRQAAFVKHIVMADKYFASSNYEAAIITYKLTINDKPKDETVYIKLADVYIAMGDYSNAWAILTEGYQATGSVKIVVKMQNMYAQENTAMPVMTLEEMEAASAEVTLNNTIIDWIATLSYSDYVRQFGKAEVQTADGGALQLFFTGFNGKCIYFNTPSNGYIVNEANQLPYANCKPNYVELTGLGCIFNGYEGVLAHHRVRELFGNEGDIEYRTDLQQYVIKLEYRNCILEFACDENGNITGGLPWNRISAKYAGENISETTEENPGRHSGYITNAMTGGGVSAEIIVHRSTRYGDVAATIKCGYDGSYDLEVSEGSYVLEVTAAGFITEYFEISVRNGDNRTAMNYVLSPLLQTGEIRIVLEWGSYPADLDSHLTGRISSGQNIEVAYYAKQAVAAGNTVAELDIDDTNGFGPETTTIYDTEGTFLFRVHDFTNGDNSASTALAASRATVKVYISGQAQPRVFNVPTGAGTWWNVFRIENGQLVEINSME